MQQREKKNSPNQQNEPVKAQKQTEHRDLKTIGNLGWGRYYTGDTLVDILNIMENNKWRIIN